MGCARNLWIQLHHCGFLGGHGTCHFHVPLGKYSQAPRKVINRKPFILKPTYNFHLSLKSSFFNYFRVSPDLSGMEISEESAVESAKLIREQVKRSVQFMFHVGAEKEWFLFAGVVACLYALSLIGNCFDLLTLCYIGKSLYCSI